MPHVYILQSLKNNKYYIGSTTDLKRRLLEHNQGKNKATRPNIPYKIIYTEEYPTIKEARQREYKIKLYKGGNAFKKLINT
jgi:putative endonuclease